MSLAPADFEFVRAFVSGRAGIMLDPGKEYLVESRLLPLAQQLGYVGIADFIASVRRPGNAVLERRLLEAMTTHETMFFRDVAPFDALRQHVIPTLMAARRTERQINIWCAAASTGQEPYSLAMLLADHFAELDRWKVQFIASDISINALDRAREGRYSQLEISRGLPPAYLDRFFTRDGTMWQVRDDIRKRIEFRQLNLIDPWPAMPRLDLVFIRNVMIYFDVSTKRAILTRIKQLLRPDGLLFLGAAESTLNIDGGFARTDYDRAGCYKLAA